MSKKILSASVLSLFSLSLFVLPVAAEDIVVTSSISPTTSKMRTDKQAAKDAFTQQIKDKKEEIGALVQQRKALFKEKSMAIKDVRKKAVVERINEKLGSINTRRTALMSDALVRLTEKLTRLEEKAALAEQSGKDTTLVDAAITNAKTAIATATTAVNTQKTKDYTLTLTTEEQLKPNVGQTVKLAQSDLRTTHAAVVAAKKAVVEVVIALAKVNGANTDTETATESAN